MFIRSQATLLLLLPLIYAFPVLERSSNAACGKFATIQSDSYTLNVDLWGENGATGEQCTQLISVDGDKVSWSSRWEWQGGSGVKSFSNMQLNVGINQQLSAITSMPSTWEWAYTYSGSIVADVAYDFFTSSAAGSTTNEHEVMVWLANYNAGPIGSYDASGKAVPIEENIPIAGHNWNLYYGSNGYNDVYSYLPVSGKINSFSEDMYGFFTHLINAGRLDSSQYLIVAEAGTEPTSGSGFFETSEYSLKIN